MSKRRTKKQKSQAIHNFGIHWEPSNKSGKAEAKKAISEPNVKGQFKKSGSKKKPSGTEEVLAKNSAELSNLALIKKDIVRSLILACLILASEVMIYLTWL